MTKKEAVFSKDLPNKKMTIVRAFDATLELVWKAWTESELLDQWWAPKPYKAVTKKMDFREGGLWLYCMMGPNNDNSWCKEEYKTIDTHKSITINVSFCDEDANVNQEFPTMDWKKQFADTGGDTTVTVEINFSKQEDMEMITGMGFEEGFTAGLNNLDNLLSTQSKK